MSRRRSEPIIELALRDGRTRYRAVAEFTPPGGQRKQVRRTFDTKREARDWLAEVRTSRRTGTLVTPTKITVGEMLDTWMLGARHLKASTRHGYEVHLRPVRERLGTIPVQALAKRDVEQLVEHMLTTGGRNGEGRSASTVRQALVVLEQAIDDAERQGLVFRNVVRLVKKPRQARREMRIWTAAQLATFLRAASKDRYAALWRIAAYGPRRSEVVGLRWPDIDLDAAVARIVRTRVSIDGKVVVDDVPKTESGKRTLDLDPQTVTLLLRFRRAQARERLAAGAAYEGSDLVAVDELGRPLSPEAFGDRFARIAKSAGLPPIRLHDLRHTAASLMHESGAVQLRTLAAILGHADPAFTLRTYAHSSDEAKRAATATLASLFDAPSAESL